MSAHSSPLVDPFLASLPFPLAQHVLLDLAGRGLWQRTELNRLRSFEARDPRPAVLDDLRLRRRPVGVQGDKGLGNLTPGVVGYGDHRAFHDGRMCRDRLLHLDRADVFTAGDDDVLLPVAQLDGAVGVANREIATVEPPAGEGAVGRLLVCEVPGHHDVPRITTSPMVRPSAGTSRIS